MNEWIHTRRGVRLVEGTLPRLAAALEDLTAEIRSKASDDGTSSAEVPWSHAERWRQEHEEGNFIDDCCTVMQPSVWRAVTSWLQGDETLPAAALKEYLVLLKHDTPPRGMTRGEMREQIVQICNLSSLWDRFGLSGQELYQAIMQEA